MQTTPPSSLPRAPPPQVDSSAHQLVGGSVGDLPIPKRNPLRLRRLPARFRQEIYGHCAEGGPNRIYYNKPYRAQPLEDEAMEETMVAAMLKLDIACEGLMDVDKRESLVLPPSYFAGRLTVTQYDGQQWKRTAPIRDCRAAKW